LVFSFSSTEDDFYSLVLPRYIVPSSDFWGDSYFEEFD